MEQEKHGFTKEEVYNLLEEIKRTNKENRINQENADYATLNAVFKDRDGRRAVEDYLSLFEKNKKASLEKQKHERILKERKDFRRSIIFKGIIACAIVVVITGFNIKHKNEKVPTISEEEVVMNLDGDYNGQGIQIFHNGKNWKEVDGKQEIVYEEMALDLSKLSENNRKFALYDITRELKIGDIFVDEHKSAQNFRDVNKIIKELSSLVGKNDTNYLNVNDLNEVVVRYGYTNYSQFAKDCQRQIDLYNSIRESETIIKGAGK